MKSLINGLNKNKIETLESRAKRSTNQDGQKWKRFKRIGSCDINSVKICFNAGKPSFSLSSCK